MIASKKYIIVLGVFTMLMAACENDDLTNANIVTTADISYLSEIEAIAGGSIHNGGRTSVNFRGVCWGTEPMPTIKNERTMDGKGAGSFISSITGLQPNTSYHIRAYASNTLGTSYGNNVSFTTKHSDIPLINTTPISNLGSTTCSSGGNIVYGGKRNVQSRGVCWSTNSPPVISDARTSDGTGLGEFTSNISGLDSDSVYYVRAYATNSEGTAYGNVLYLKPIKSTVSDIDGNEYATLSIGSQVWTAENLKVTRYQNGEPIQHILDPAEWNNMETGAYCDYDHDPLNQNTYGRLYNWYAASDSRNIAPEGWHVATYEEYLVLVDFLGGQGKAEEEIKNVGFNLVPAGKRGRDGIFHEKDISPYFWTSTEFHEGSKWAWYFLFDGGYLNINTLSKNYGFSVRCVRD